MKHFEEAKILWKKYVPASGQAETVQGELMRCIEKLRYEAQENGNLNWDKEFEMIADFIKDTLLNEESFDEIAKVGIVNDIYRISEFEYPYTDDDLYDRLTDWIVEWSFAHPSPFPINTIVI